MQSPRLLGKIGRTTAGIATHIIFLRSPADPDYELCPMRKTGMSHPTGPAELFEIQASHASPFNSNGIMPLEGCQEPDLTTGGHVM